ncbi:MAG: hypothetical protein M1335_07740 [Chloroflexi bacterium]|nr:hypothetical protein [Chloroflexota bacterium]
MIILQGRGSRLKYIANTLISTRGVKHGQMVCTTTGKEVS